MQSSRGDEAASVDVFDARSPAQSGASPVTSGVLSRLRCAAAASAPPMCLERAHLDVVAVRVAQHLSMSNRAAHTVQSIGHLGDDDLEYSGVMDALELANRVRAQDVLIDTLKSPHSLPVIGWLLRVAMGILVARIWANVYVICPKILGKCRDVT